MLIANKYEVKVDISLKKGKKKIILLKFILPRILYKEKSGIVDQFTANCWFPIIDDFPLT